MFDRAFHFHVWLRRSGVVPADGPLSATYSGSLLNKRKAELVEIASALKLDADAKMTDMIKSIQGYLEAHEPELREVPMFKGLYGSRRGRT